jgi:hypothetical protein
MVISHWNQVSTYAIKISKNFKSLNPLQNITKVVLSIWIYYRKKTIPATMRNLVHQERIEVPVNTLYKSVIKMLRGKWMKPWDLAPFHKGYIDLSC